MKNPREELLKLRQQVSLAYQMVALLPMLFRDKGDVLSHLTRTTSRWQELNDLLNSNLHRLKPTNVTVPIPCAEDSVERTACEGACSLLFSLKIFLDVLKPGDSLAWVNHPFENEFTMLSKIASEEINIALKDLDDSGISSELTKPLAKADARELIGCRETKFKKMLRDGALGLVEENSRSVRMLQSEFDKLKK